MRKRAKRKFYRLNWNITASKIRVINEEGKQVGILRKEEALKLAQDQGVDLVEIAPHVSPPVCKLIDFKKFLYQEKKKRRERKEKKVELKEIRLRPFIGEHDYQTRLAQAQEFLKDGSKLRIRLRFFGREITRKELGFELLDRFLKDLENFGKKEKEPQLKGGNVVVLVTPKKQNEQKEKSKNKEDCSKKV